MSELPYLRLRASVMREASMLIRHCHLPQDQHPTYEEDVLHKQIDSLAEKLLDVARATDEAASLIEDAEHRKPTPGFWPTLQDYENAMDRVAERREARIGDSRRSPDPTIEQFADVDVELPHD